MCAARGRRAARLSSVPRSCRSLLPRSGGARRPSGVDCRPRRRRLQHRPHRRQLHRHRRLTIQRTLTNEIACAVVRVRVRVRCRGFDLTLAVVCSHSFQPFQFKQLQALLEIRSRLKKGGTTHEKEEGGTMKGPPPSSIQRVGRLLIPPPSSPCTTLALNEPFHETSVYFGRFSSKLVKVSRERKIEVVAQRLKSNQTTFKQVRGAVLYLFVAQGLQTKRWRCRYGWWPRSHSRWDAPTPASWPPSPSLGPSARPCCLPPYLPPRRQYPL